MIAASGAAGARTLLAFCRTEPFAHRALALGGYDIGVLGRVMFNA